MPIKLSDLQKQTRPLTLDFSGEQINVIYRPGAITPALTARFVDMSNAEAVPIIVAEWDILGDDGQPLPVTAEICETLPLEFLRAVVREVIADSASPKANKPS